MEFQSCRDDIYAARRFGSDESDPYGSIRLRRKSVNPTTLTNISILCYYFSVEFKERRYETFLGIDCRRRHFREYIGKWITGFTVQLEVLIEDKWYPVIRYDTSHGFFHRDYIRSDGTVEKTEINVNDFKEALTFSENDIKANWKFYREKFLQEVKQNDR